jgi:hypothetical protein
LSIALLERSDNTLSGPVFDKVAARNSGTSGVSGRCLLEVVGFESGSAVAEFCGHKQAVAAARQAELGVDSSDTVLAAIRRKFFAKFKQKKQVVTIRYARRISASDLYRMDSLYRASTCACMERGNITGGAKIYIYI